MPQASASAVRLHVTEGQDGLGMLTKTLTIEGVAIPSGPNGSFRSHADLTIVVQFDSPADHTIRDLSRLTFEWLRDILLEAYPPKQPPRAI